MHEQPAGNAPSDAAPAHCFRLPEHGLYLDTATHGPRLRAVHDAAHAALDAGIAPWRQTDAQWEAAIDRVRALAAACFDDDADAVALVPSAAYGIATATQPATRARRG